MIQSIFKTVSLIKEFMDFDPEQHSRDIADQIQRQAIDQANKADAEKIAAEPQSYKTDEFYDNLNTVTDEFAKTYDEVRAMFQARIDGLLPPVFAEDEGQHLERERDQLNDWLMEQEI